MEWESLPNGFWIIYYLLLIVTIVAAIFSVTKNRFRILSILAIAFSITIPIVALLHSIGRQAGMNEFEHLLSEVQQGAMWALFVGTGYLFILIWWVLFLSKGIRH